jgi:protoheme ferro-lyase
LVLPARSASEVFLTISNHTLAGKELIDALHVQDEVPIDYTGPLYDSDTLKHMFVQRANEQIEDTDKAQGGMLFVGHGQPDEWDETWPTETDHENAFRHRVLDLLVKDGFRRENVSLVWMEFKEPKPTQKVEGFVARGVEKIHYSPAAISADGIHSQYDIPEQVEKARVPTGFPLINLNAWNDAPLVIQAIKEKIDLAMLHVRETEQNR